MLLHCVSTEPMRTKNIEFLLINENVPKLSHPEVAKLGKAGSE